MAYFYGGDFVELLSAQGKAPAASWKLQGKISKTFDKGIKGNAFTLDGHSETKMQLPKTASSSLGLAQRFVILQLLVPFTRSFSVEICYSDFQKARRRFVVASAFRDTARTALHVQLPLNAAGIPRDQWMNLVFDLQTLSEMHFPDTGYRSMESVCVSGSCRLKRIFTMKDAPTPSQGSNVVRHADIRDIPRQFVFSATQRGVSGASPIPTLYFSTVSAFGIGGIHGVAVGATNSVVNSGDPKSSRRSQTAPTTKSQAKGTRAVRPTTVLLHRKTPTLPQPVTPDMDSDKPSGQRLRTPARVNTTASKLRQPKSSQGKMIIAQREIYSRDTDSSSPRLRVAVRAQELTFEDMPKNFTPRSESPIRPNKSQEVEKEEIVAAAPPAPTVSTSLDRALSPPSSVHSSVMSSPNELQPELRSQTLRQSIMGEIQQKIASLEADDERADQRDRELFLRHTSLHSGEWHLQKLRDDDLDDDDGTLLSDDEGDFQLSSSWRRELTEPAANLLNKSLEVMKNPDDTIVKASVASRYNADKESIFSFSSVEPGTTTAQKDTSRLFDFDSLLQDVEPLTAPQPTSRAETEPPIYEQLEKRIDSALADTESDADDLELTKLLAAERSVRQLLHMQSIDHEQTENELNPSLSNPRGDKLTIENDSNELEEDSHDLTLQRHEDIADTTGERDDWVVEKNTADPVHDNEVDSSTDTTALDQAIQDNVDRRSTRDEDSDIDVGGDVRGLSMDLTSELSASGGESEHELNRVDNNESSSGPASPQTDEPKPDRDRNSSKSHHDDLDDDSSFDFDDLVDNAESSDDRDENEEQRVQTTVPVSIEKTSSQQKPTQVPRDLNPKLASSPQKNQVTREKRRGPPVPPRRMAPVKSPLINYHERTQAKLSQRESREQSLKSSHAIELSSSFSSRRLQSLLKSTDWTAELNAQANIFPTSSPPPTRSSDRKQRPHASSTDIRSSDSKGSANQSSQKPSRRPQTPSNSSIELVYDPLLRCYYDPVANKYYALAE